MTEDDLLKQLEGLSKNNAQAAQLVQQLRGLRAQEPIRPRHSSPGGALFGALAQTIDSGRSAVQEYKVNDALGKTDAERTAARAKIMRDIMSGDVQRPIQKPVTQGGSFNVGDPVPQQQQMEAVPRSKIATMLRSSGDETLSGVGGDLLSQERLEALVRQKMAEYATGRQDKAADTASQRAWQEQQNELNRKSQERAASLSAGRTQENAIAAEDRADLRKREASAREIEERAANAAKSLAQLESLVGENGTFEAVGPHNAMLEGAITDYATDMAKLKDPTSVARESEVETEKKALFSPGLKTRNATALELIKNAKQRVQQRRDEAYKVRGLRTPGAQGGRVRVTNGSETLEIDAADLADAVKDGYRPQ